MKLQYIYKTYPGDEEATNISRNRAGSITYITSLLGLAILLSLVILFDGLSNHNFEIILGTAMICGVVYYFKYSSVISPINDEIFIDEFKIDKYKKYINSQNSINTVNYYSSKLEIDTQRKKDEMRKINKFAFTILLPAVGLSAVWMLVVMLLNR